MNLRSGPTGFNESFIRFFLLLLAGRLNFAIGVVSCVRTSECESMLRDGSECINGFCTNPFSKGGCLRNALGEEGKRYMRVCNSEDPPGSAEAGLCRTPDSLFNYTEIRVYSQNWESAIFEAWILQILLMELLDVPVTIENGSPTKKIDFYDINSSLDFGTGNDWDALKRGSEVGDCRKIASTSEEEYKACAHMTPEVWSGHFNTIDNLVREGVLEPPEGLGTLGQHGWFVPKFTGERDPTVLSYLGLRGEENRRKLAETFLRPTTWKDYCDLVSPDYCATANEVASRPPEDETENDRMYVEGVYTGHFRKTEKNDCDTYPHNCTGHIADFPCGWSSFLKAQTYHLNISLESDGKEGESHGYTYSQLSEMWAAAKATKSNLMMQWWKPEALFQSVIGTDAEMQRIALPPATEDCEKARIKPESRCGGTFEEQVGDPAGACEEPTQIIRKVIGSSLYKITKDQSIPQAKRSPGYDAVRAFKMSDLQIGKMFEMWLERGTDKWNYDPRDAVCEWVVQNLDIMESFVPRTHPRVLKEQDFYSDKLHIVALVIGILVTVVVLLVSVVTYRWRRRPVMVYAQVEFLLLLLVGLTMVSLGSVVVAVPPSTASCVAVAWLINLGYTFELVPLIIKMMAIKKLLSAAQQMRRISLSREWLLGAVFLVGAVVALLLTIWTVVDPPKEDKYLTLTHDITKHGETTVMTNQVCYQGPVWKYLAISWHAFLLLCATSLAFQTRFIRKDMRESKTLAMMIYSHFIFVVLRLIIFMVEEAMPNCDLAGFRSMIFSLDALATVCIYFLPKFFGRHAELENQRRSSDTRWSSVPRRGSNDYGTGRTDFTSKPEQDRSSEGSDSRCLGNENPPSIDSTAANTKVFDEDICCP